VTARHINDQMTHEMEVNLAGGLASVLLEGKGGAVGGQVAPQIIQLGGQSVMLRFSRAQENEADSLGLRYMTKAGYDPKQMLGVMQVLVEAMQGNRSPEFFSTHPYPETRIKTITEQLQKNYANAKGVTNEQQYQQRMLRPLGTHALRPASGATVAANFGKLGDPVLWCEHCRREARMASGE
jgi:predicted Zn-dependent protease